MHGDTQAWIGESDWEEVQERLRKVEKRLETLAVSSGNLEAARNAVKALVEESFIAGEWKFGEAERDLYHARHWQALLNAVCLTDIFCSACGQWHDPKTPHNCSF